MYETNYIKINFRYILKNMKQITLKSISDIFLNTSKDCYLLSAAHKIELYIPFNNLF